MKRNILLFAVIIACFTFHSCETTEIPETKVLVENFDQLEQFCPSYEVKLKNGMMVFDSKIAFDVTLVEILNTDPDMVDNWYKSIGVETFYKVFNDVLAAEEAIETNLYSLPKEEQEYWIQKGEFHSDEYTKAIEEGILVKSNEEGNSTYDYNLADKTVAPLVNKDGLVQIEGKIHQYQENSIIIVNKVDVSDLKSDKLGLNEKAIIIDYSDCNLKSINTYNWTRKDSDYAKDGRRHRALFWIDGHSELVIHQFPDGSWTNDHCSDYIDCTFYLRIVCQKKNFWGNWVWETSVPSTTINANWSYNYGSYDSDPYITYGCGLYDRDISYVPSYSCSPNPNSVCPTSPISNLILTGNNYYYPVTPHGRWHTTTAYFFSHPLDLSGSATATFSGDYDKDFDYSW
jgi:hypothetical protein